jgi:hypothetical protein
MLSWFTLWAHDRLTAPSRNARPTQGKKDGRSESNPISENCRFLADFMRTAGFMSIFDKVRIIAGYLTL